MKYKSIVLAAALTIFLTGCAGIEKDNSYVIDMGAVGIPDETEPPTEPPFEKADVSILAVGDNLIHSCVYKTASDHAPDGIVYNFDYCYQNISDRISQADIAMISQNTLICNGELALSGAKQKFNSPVELGYDLAGIGFDVFSIGSSHVLDNGANGLELTLDYWEGLQKDYRNVLVTGAYRTEQDMQNYRVMEKDGLQIGFLDYTATTNGNTLPEDSSLIVARTEQEELMQNQIKELSGQVDCLIVSMYWGTEDSHEVDDSVKELAQNVINWGADVIIGTGSHTLQTMEYLKRPDGSKGFVFYSLGNFISGQTDNFNMIGGMAEFRVCRDNQGEISLRDIEVTPVITQYESGMTNVRNYPYDEYTTELMEKHYLPYSGGGYAKKWNWEVIDTIIEENIPPQYRKNYTNQSAETETESTDED